MSARKAPKRKFKKKAVRELALMMGGAATVGDAALVAVSYASVEAGAAVIEEMHGAEAAGMMRDAIDAHHAATSIHRVGTVLTKKPKKNARKK